MGSYKRKDRKDWSYQFKFRGVRYSTRGFKDRREADTALEKRRKEVKREYAQQSRALTDTDFLTITNLYLDYAVIRFAKSTYKDKARCYAKFNKYLLSLPVSLSIAEISPKIVLDFINKRPSANNFNVYRKELSALFTYAINVLQIDMKNPCRAIEKIPHTPQLPRMMSEEEFLRIMAAATAEERDLILVIALTVARVDEALRLKWEDVNFDTRIVRKWTAKRKGGAYAPIDVPMGQDLYDILWRRWKAKIQNEWVFYNEKTETRYMHRPKLMRSLCQRAGIKPLAPTVRRKPAWDKTHKKRVYVPKEDFNYYGFHAIRHFVASYMSNVSKISTRIIQSYLGHQDERTTKIYLHLLDSQMVEAAESLDGIFTENLAKVQPKGTANDN